LIHEGKPPVAQAGDHRSLGGLDLDLVPGSSSLDPPQSRISTSVWTRTAGQRPLHKPRGHLVGVDALEVRARE